MSGRDGDTEEGVSLPPGPYPIRGTALVKTAALASVPAERLPALLAQVQADLGPRIEEYRRRYERIAVEPDRETFLVESDHWDGIADRLGFSGRERDAVTRAHETTAERAGSGETRREEFETALEIRSAVVIGTGEPEGGESEGGESTGETDVGESTVETDVGESTGETDVGETDDGSDDGVETPIVNDTK